MVPEFKAFFESNLVGNGQSYPAKNTHFQSGKLVWDAAFMWPESSQSLVLARQPSSLSISSGLLLVRLQDSNFPAAAAALASGLSLFQLGCFSPRCLWTVIVEDRPNQTVPCPKELLLFYEYSSSSFLRSNCNTTHTVQTHVHQTVP